MKIDLLNPKTLLKLVAKTFKKIGIFALGILGENNSRGGQFITPQKSARWQPEKGRNALPVDRPTVIFMTVEPSVDRPSPRPGYREQKLSTGQPPGRPGPDPESRAIWRSIDPSASPPAYTVVHVCAYRSTDRFRSTGRRPCKQ